MRFPGALLIVAACAVTTPAFAVDWADPQSVVAAALDNNPTILRLQTEVAAARERIAPAGALPNPMAMAGVQPPDASNRRLDGVNLLPVMLEGKSLKPRQAFWWYNEQEAMRDGDWKLVVNLRGQKEPALYNLKIDRAEQNDVSAKHPQRVAAMQQAIGAWKQDVERAATPQPEAR